MIQYIRYYQQWLLKGVSLLTMATLFFNTVGHWWLFAVLDKYHYEVHLTQVEAASYSDEDLQLLTFSRQDLDNNVVNLEWEESYEFRYKGAMYDIAERRKTADSVYYRVKRDYEEEEAIQVFQKIEATKQSGSQDHQKGLLGWVKLIIDRAAFDNDVNTLSIPPFAHIFSIYKPQLKQAFLGIELPPPLATIS